MTEEEKNAIEWLKYEIDEAHRELEKRRNDEHKGYGTAEDVAKLVYCNRHNLLNLIQKQDTEINKLNNVIDRMAEDIIDYEKDLKYEESYKNKEEVIGYYNRITE